MTGTVLIEGTGGFAGHTLKIWHQNENHITWLDDEPYVTSPDLIMTADLKTGQPYTNADIAKGTELAIIGRPPTPAVRRAGGNRRGAGPATTASTSTTARSPKSSDPSGCPRSARRPGKSLVPALHVGAVGVEQVAGLEELVVVVDVEMVDPAGTSC